MIKGRKWQYGLGLGLALLLVGSQVTPLLDGWQGVTGMMLLAGLLLWLNRSSPSPPPPPTLPTRLQLQQELKEVQAVIAKIRSEPKQQTLFTQAHQLSGNIAHYQNFHIAVYGGKGVGKTTLIEVLKGIEKPPNLRQQRKLTMLETQDHKTAQATDLILLVIDGVLRASEYREILKLHQQHKRIILVLNKTDLYLPSELSVILDELREQTQNVLSDTDILAVAAAPQPIKVKQSPLKQWWEPVPPEVENLRARLAQILAQEWDVLQISNLQQKVQYLHRKAQQTLYDDYRQEGEKIIQKYQWVTGAAVFANPLSGLDLIANAAINTQMLIELGQAYDRPLQINEARETATILAQSLLKLGLVEILTGAVASVLKFNTFTFAFGGALQAFSAAYLTRVGGVSFMKYIEQQLPPIDHEPMETKPLGVLCEETFTAMQSQPLIQAFVQEAALQITTTER